MTFILCRSFWQPSTHKIQEGKTVSGRTNRVFIWSRWEMIVAWIPVAVVEMVRKLIPEICTRFSQRIYWWIGFRAWRKRKYKDDSKAFLFCFCQNDQNSRCHFPGMEKKITNTYGEYSTYKVLCFKLDVHYLYYFPQQLYLDGCHNDPVLQTRKSKHKSG